MQDVMCYVLTDIEESYEPRYYKLIDLCVACYNAILYTSDLL